MAEPEAPLGAGPGAGLTGGPPTAAPPWPAPEGEAAVAASEATVAARPIGADERKRWLPRRPAVRLPDGHPPSAESWQLDSLARFTAAFFAGASSEVTPASYASGASTGTPAGTDTAAAGPVSEPVEAAGTSGVISLAMPSRV
jgi:hypothetical protein